jgi:hypothetical protein
VEATGASVGPNVQPAPAVLELVEHAWVTTTTTAIDATATVRFQSESDRCIPKAYRSLALARATRPGGHIA